MSEKRRIKILDTEYKEEEKLVYWHVEVLDDKKKIKLAMRAKELMDGFGIVGDVTTEQMLKFLSDIKGKEIDWVFEVRSRNLPDKITEDNAAQIAGVIDGDPYPEVFRAETKDL